MAYTDDELQAFVDGELDEVTRGRFDALVAEDPTLAARVAELRQTDARLRTEVLEGLSRPPHPGLDPTAVRRRLRERSASRQRLVLAAAFAVCLGGAGGWYARGSVLNEPMQDAVDAHRVFALDGLPIEVTTSDPVHLRNVLEARIEHRLLVPDLTREGFALLGGRVLSTSDGPAALVLYEDREGSKLSFYLRPSSKIAPGTRGSRQEGALLAQYWFQNGYGFALVGRAADPRTERIKGRFGADS
jgi:anti-sigma factor RsiW